MHERVSGGKERVGEREKERKRERERERTGLYSVLFPAVCPPALDTLFGCQRGGGGSIVSYFPAVSPPALGRWTTELLLLLLLRTTVDNILKKDSTAHSQRRPVWSGWASVPLAPSPFLDMTSSPHLIGYLDMLGMEL